MRAGAAVLLFAVAACATAPAPAPLATPATTTTTPSPSPSPSPPPPPPPSPSPVTLAERVVDAQVRSSTESGSWMVTDVFDPVQADLDANDEQQVVTAVRVLAEIAAAAARRRQAAGWRADGPAGAWDGLDPLLDRLEHMLIRLRTAAGCATVNEAWRATAALDAVPRARPPVQGQPAAPDRELSKQTLLCGMMSVRDKVNECFARYQIPGIVMVNVVVGRRGLVSGAVVTGKFAGSPTGACVEAAVKTVVFPPSNGISFPFPFALK